MKKPVDVAYELIPAADALGPRLVFDRQGNLILDTRPKPEPEPPTDTEPEPPRNVG
jgi:hypothetical protein